MPSDARLKELELLDKLERNVSVTLDPILDDFQVRRLVVHLLAEGYVNDASEVYFSDEQKIMDNAINWYRAKVEEEQWDLIRKVRNRQPIRLVISHRGAVRRAELEQALKLGRIRDPFGLVWDGRHFRQDTRIALLEADPSRPLAVAYLDLNDVKRFNEVSHATGDDAIKRYLEVVADVVTDRGDVYRLSGGADEVVVLLPRCNLEEASVLLRSLIRELGRQTIAAAQLTLRVSAGVIIATNPTEPVDAVKDRADKMQARAKLASRGHPMRMSFLAWGKAGTEIEEVNLHATTP